MTRLKELTHANEGECILIINANKLPVCLMVKRNNVLSRL